jgi:hypothetical protein
MIIKPLDQKYRINCKRGTIYESKGILERLNSIIEWDKVEGDLPQSYEGQEIKPGNCFVLCDQVMAANSKDELVMVLSTTGYYALKRIIEEYIEAEYELMNLELLEKDRIFVDTLDEMPEEFDTPLRIPYPTFKIWKARKEDYNDEKILRVKLKEDFGYLEFIFKDWDIHVKSEDFDEDEVDYAQSLAFKLMHSLL